MNLGDCHVTDMYWIWCVWAELVNQSLHSPMTVPLGQTFMLLLSSLWKQCWCLACVVRVTWGRSAHIFSITLYRREILRWPVTECQNSVMWLVGQLVLTWTFAGKGIFPRLSRHPHALRVLFLSLSSQGFWTSIKPSPTIDATFSSLRQQTGIFQIHLSSVYTIDL